LTGKSRPMCDLCNITQSIYNTHRTNSWTFAV
jgi:hypothetical protein